MQLSNCRDYAERWRARNYREPAQEVEVVPVDQHTPYELEAEDDAVTDTSWFDGLLIHLAPLLTELGVTGPRVVGELGTVLRTWIGAFVANQTSVTDRARLESERDAALQESDRLRAEADALRDQLRDSRAEVGRLTSVAAEANAEVA